MSFVFSMISVRLEAGYLLPTVSASAYLALFPILVFRVSAIFSFRRCLSGSTLTSPLSDSASRQVRGTRCTRFAARPSGVSGNLSFAVSGALARFRLACRA